uniref:NodB homology domain-containing protein n=1 Tax=Heliconius erato TaxID=33431 RepID=L7X1K8_HELEA|nr:hypothetical protein [Heliconius erato]
MKFALALGILMLAVLACAESELPLAEPCNEDFVLLTFDDGINVQNIETYRSMIYNRYNKNSCPAGVTFFVSHEYTDYSLVNELYNQGFEIALHSISHVTNQEYWRNADYDTLMKEFGDQKTQIAHFANIPEEEVKGIRSPFLQMSGNATYQMMASTGLRYDLSWPTTSFTNPGLWPYTLHYRSIQDCVVPPCPSASIPGPWILPIVAWSDLQGIPCSFVDTCFYNPGNDEDGWFRFIVQNFERHYFGNRAPFGFYVHEAFFRVSPAASRALIRFLDMINNLNDVFMVNADEVIDWVQNPIPLNEYSRKICPRRLPRSCSVSNCGPYIGDHNQNDNMKCVLWLVAILGFVSVRAQLPSAEPCIESACQLPDCRCSSTNVPGNLNPRDIPQFVLVTFDGAVSVSNIVDYRDLLYRRNNKNSCPVRATFFVSHEYTDYTFVNELYNRGFEIGLNSMTRHYSQQYWRDASEETLMREFSDQRNYNEININGQLPSAEPCQESACQLPNCRCSSTNIPGNLDSRDTPQFVLITFDNAVSQDNIGIYRDLLYQRTNKNSCPVRATFFVSHEYSDYTLVNELYNRGFEIGLNSISHQGNQEYWRYASQEVLMSEFNDQRDQIAHFANIPASAVQGIRAPLLQLSGNASFEMMIKANFKYDMSWPTVLFQNPGLWPYTLDYMSIQDCITPYCPTASLPGPWVVPMIAWSDLLGIPCTVINSCFYSPPDDDENAWFNFFVSNFERHYLGNRAPFGFHIGQGFFSRNVAIYRAALRFFDMLNNLHDVFMVSADEAVEWVKNPIPINEYSRKQCPSRSQSVCRATPCNGLEAQHTSELFYMQICNRCPRVYPWVNNPFGVLQN